MGHVGSKGGIRARGEKGDKGDTDDVGQQGHIASQGSTGPRGVQGAKVLRAIVGIQGPLEVQGPVGSTGGQGDRGSKGDKGDRRAPAVDIDIVSELCKHLPIAIVEQYRRGAYARYAINSMKDIELHGAALVKTIIDKGGRCNAIQSDSNYVLNFHNDAYNMEGNIHDFHYFCVFLVYKITAYAKIEHWERNYLISNWTGEKEGKYRGICFVLDKKTLRINGAGCVGSNDTFDFRAWRKTNQCKENRFHVICVEYVKRPVKIILVKHYFW